MAGELPDMRPRLARRDAQNRVSVYSVTLGYGRVAFSILMEAANRLHILFGQAREMCAFAPWSIGSALGAFVGHVIGVRAEKQMPRINARLVVALVAHACASKVATGNGWDFAMRENPRDPVGRLDASTKADAAIASAASRCAPRPAFIFGSNVYLRPETFGLCLCPSRHR